MQFFEKQFKKWEYRSIEDFVTNSDRFSESLLSESLLQNLYRITIDRSGWWNKSSISNVCKK